MSVRVRFAPSPTGYLHIGGARTCLYNFLFAKATGGKLILRVEDTDLERSSLEFEKSQVNDLKWLGIAYDEGPDKPGEYGPYRQSERTEIYQRYSSQLLEEGKAFYCFCSDEELEKMREKAISEGRDPIYDGTWRDFPLEQAREKVANGESAAIRFKVPNKNYILEDVVRGKVNFHANMVGDFVIQRSSGMPTFNFCCVVDDILMKITHVIRGEDHLNNTLRQLMVYEALGAGTPTFGHVSLLVGEDRQKLSKRHGATSVSQYREQNYLPQALSNYLCLLGWSHPDEKDIFTMEEISEIFNLDRFSKSAALYDIEKLKWVNSQHFKNLDDQLIGELLAAVDHPAISTFKAEGADWKHEFCSLFKEKVQLLNELIPLLEGVYSESISLGDDAKEVLGWETTPKIANYILEELEKSNDEFISEDIFSGWMNDLKKNIGIKGKPLFMGLRVTLTGVCHGPDLKRLVPLTKKSTLSARVKEIASQL